MRKGHAHCPACSQMRLQWYLLGVLHSSPFTCKAARRLGLNWLGLGVGGHLTPLHVISHICSQAKYVETYCTSAFSGPTKPYTYTYTVQMRHKFRYAEDDIDIHIWNCFRQTQFSLDQLHRQNSQECTTDTLVEQLHILNSYMQNSYVYIEVQLHVQNSSNFILFIQCSAFLVHNPRGHILHTVVNCCQAMH